MEVPFPEDIEKFNVTDYDILRCLYREGPLWKTEITRKINHNRSGRPLLEKKRKISKQAVSRRVERLHRLDFLEKAIISPEAVKADKKPSRDFIEGYQLSRKGEHSLEQATRKVIRDAITCAIKGDKVSRIDSYLELYSNLIDSDVSSMEDFVEEETKYH